MSVRELFIEEWQKKFGEDPLPCNLLFLDYENDNLTSLASALDSSERTIAKLERERSKQLLIRDFVVERMDLALSARVRNNSQTSASSKQELSENGARRLSPCQLNSDELPVKSQSKTTVRTSYGQPMRAQGAAAQIAAVMTTAKNKLGFSSWSSARRSASPSRDKPAAGRRDDGKNGKKSTAVSRFYDAFGESNMVRACSAPSLIDDNLEYRSKKLPLSIKNSFIDMSSTVSLYNVESSDSSSRNSVQCISKENTSSYPIIRDCKSDFSANVLLETDIDEMSVSSPPPLPPPVERSSNIDSPRKSASRQRQAVYEEPIEFRKDAAGEMVDEESDNEHDVSSDEEPLYFNLLLLKEHTLSKANQLYSSFDQHVGDILSPAVLVDHSTEDPFLIKLRKPDLPIGKY